MNGGPRPCFDIVFQLLAPPFNEDRSCFPEDIPRQTSSISTQHLSHFLSPPIPPSCNHILLKPAHQPVQLFMLLNKSTCSCSHLNLRQQELTIWKPERDTQIETLPGPLVQIVTGFARPTLILWFFDSLSNTVASLWSRHLHKLPFIFHSHKSWTISWFLANKFELRIFQSDSFGLRRFRRPLSS